MREDTNYRFVRQLTVLAGSSGAVQLLSLLAIPLIARLYDPADFGTLGVFVALLAFASVIATLRYELAIPLPETDTSAAQILGASLLAVAVTTVGVSIAIYSCGVYLTAILGIKTPDSFLWLLPVGVFLTGVFNTFAYWGIRKQQYGRIATAKLSQNVAMLTIQAFGSAFGAFGLVLGQTAGQTAGSFRLFHAAWKDGVFRELSLSSTTRAIRTYSRFPLYSTPGAVLNTVASAAIPLFVSSIYSASAAGLYVMAVRVLGVPSSLVGTAVSQIFLANGADAFRAGRLPRLVDQVHNVLLALSVPIFLSAYLLAPIAFPLVLGDDWIDSGRIAAALAISFGVQFVSSPISMLFTITNQEGRYFYWQGSQALLALIAVAIGWGTGGYSQMLFCLAIAGLVSYGSLYVWERLTMELPVIPNSPRSQQLLIATVIVILCSTSETYFRFSSAPVLSLILFACLSPLFFFSIKSSLREVGHASLS